MTFQCMIIEDEPLARDVIKHYMSRLPALKLVAECSNALEAAEQIIQVNPEIIFCDVKMPKLNGLDFLKSLHHSPSVIITTAFEKYAVAGFEIGVVDFLVKPFRFERFEKAVHRAIDSIAHLKSDAHIIIRADGVHVKILLQEITFIEAMGNYIRINIIGQKPLMSKEKISQIEAQLPNTLFVRIHRSYIVSLKHFSKINTQNVWVQDTELPVSSMYRKNFLHLVAKAGFKY